MKTLVAETCSNIRTLEQFLKHTDTQGLVTDTA